jgi:hypothetical protein
MEKTLYIHIGAHKTGTTAIQQFLSGNRKKLLQNGCLYPGNQRAHHDLVRELRTLTIGEIGKNKNCATRRYFDEIDRSRENKIIISSEAFENSGIFIDKLKELIDGRFKIKIICYVRRQDEKIESEYNQYVRSPKRRYNKPIADFIKTKLGSIAEDFSIPEETGKRSPYSDYSSILLPWSKAFGRDNIIVRCYEEEQLPQGIFHDFLDTVGLTLDDRYRIPQTRINERLQWDLIEIIRLCNISFRDDLRFHQFLVKHLTQINTGYQGKREHLLSPQQRRDIISRYEDSNAQVAREYLGRPDGRLFYTPLPDPSESWEPYKGLTAERIVPVFTQMLFNIDNQKRMAENRSIKGKIKATIKKIGSRLGLLPTMQDWYNTVYRS